MHDASSRGEWNNQQRPGSSAIHSDKLPFIGYDYATHAVHRRDCSGMHHRVIDWRTLSASSLLSEHRAPLLLPIKQLPSRQTPQQPRAPAPKKDRYLIAR
jgi:hypothetical protein